jgi:DNA-binding response OmpR family regulator
MAVVAKRVLIVEDEKPLAKVLDNKLRFEGFTTRVVGNGKDAIDALNTEEYDVMLLDMMMPVLDGFKVLEHLHTMVKKPITFALSNLSLHDDQDRVLGMGAKKYFIKSETSLEAVIEEVKKA